LQLQKRIDRLQREFTAVAAQNDSRKQVLESLGARFEGLETERDLLAIEKQLLIDDLEAKLVAKDAEIEGLKHDLEFRVTAKDAEIEGLRYGQDPPILRSRATTPAS
jgi:predicted RNase H-like nuclease (RuvC/YqgF family)